MTGEVDFRRAWTQIVATLTRILGPRHLAIAEEAAQDALLKATQRWPHEGEPAHPTAWLIQVAKHQALDVLRRERWLAEHAALVAAPDRHEPASDARLAGEPDAIDDDQLAMMFLACHPRLSREARVALTLKSVCGFSVGEIARALVSSGDAVAQRLVRAKRQLRDEDLRSAVEPADYAGRLESVLDVLYLLFNEGYTAHAGVPAAGDTRSAGAGDRRPRRGRGASRRRWRVSARTSRRDFFAGSFRPRPSSSRSCRA